MIFVEAADKVNCESMPANITMDDSERRKYARTEYSVPIEITSFGKSVRFSGQTLNHSNDGMCFESRSSFKSGQTLSIRVTNFHPRGQCVGSCEGLRTISLADVKWCEQVPDTPIYEVGIQLYPTAY